MKNTFIILFLSVIAVKSYAQIPEEKPLYTGEMRHDKVHHPMEESYVDSFVYENSLSGENRVYSFVSKPTYQLYPAPDSINTKIGVVICPGGGLRNIWLDKEGTDLALWLSQRGVNCLVLKYRVNRRDANGKWEIDPNTYKPAAYFDAMEALKIMRTSEEVNVDPNKVGMIGFSAGGWLIARITTRTLEGREGTSIDALPDFIGLVYWGASQKVYRKIKNPELLPPIFMAIGRDDGRLPVKEISPLLLTLAVEIPGSELHIYGKGKHGFGLAYENGHSVELWKESYLRWLKDIEPILEK